MILSDNAILQEMEKGTIKIEPFFRDFLGSNSYDCHLSPHLAIYKPTGYPQNTFSVGCEDALVKLVTNKYTLDQVSSVVTAKNFFMLDAKKHNEVIHFDIPEKGLFLYPDILYLGSTVEYTETHAHVPFIEGKSSTGRLGIDIHATAGKGDVGFCGNWTLEISVKHPVRVYAGMPIGQLIYFPVHGEVENPYNKKSNAKYSGQPGKPVESMMWKNPIPSPKIAEYLQSKK